MVLPQAKVRPVPTEPQPLNLNLPEEDTSKERASGPTKLRNSLTYINMHNNLNCNEIQQSELIQLR